jgi:hypothetical protein
MTKHIEGLDKNAIELSEEEMEDAMRKMQEVSEAMQKDKCELDPEMQKMVEILTTPPNPDGKWEDFIAMLKDMKEHAAANGGAIVQEDRPMQLRWGYRCQNTGKTWSIRIADLKKSMDNMPPDKAEVMLLVVLTKKSKEKLLAVINGK